ncbi:MAG: sulfatase family protein, partial [Chloroflexota bacterium]
ATIMTGEYASTNGVKVHMVDKLKPGSQTLATVFEGAGYQTAGLYSWVSLDPQFCGLNQGFQTYQGYVLNRGTVFSNPQLEQLAHTYRQIKSAVPVISAADAVIGESQDMEETLDGRADVTNQAVFNWLDGHAGTDPFFLWVHYFDPHYPYAPPAGWDHILGLNYQGTIDGSVDTIHKIENHELTPNAADLARLGELYQGEIAFTDNQLGKLFDYLTKLGIADDTIVVVTGDHGESFGEHGDWTHGLKVYETEIRVPLLMRYPRRLPAGLVVPAPAQLIDIMPTVLELAGVAAQRPVQGQSLFSIVQGATKGSDRAAFTELADDSFVSVLNFGEWKLIHNNANGELQLYNLNVDEAEQTNLANEQPQTTTELDARLRDLMKISGVTH